MDLNEIKQDAMIDVRNLHFSREDKVIFRGMSLQVPRNKVTAIMGPSGTGKTTLLRLIGGQYKPSSGDIFVDGQNVPTLSSKQLYSLRRTMGVLFQEGALFSDFNVFDNVAFPLREHTDLPADMVRDLVLMKLEAVGLRGASHLRVEQLSGGMSRRAAMARATILGPNLMLYDEPFSGQDPIARGVLIKLIRQLNDALGLTSVVVSHDVAETAEVADHVYIIFDGKVIGSGAPRELFQQEDPEVFQFIHGKPDGVVSFHYPTKNTITEDLRL